MTNTLIIPSKSINPDFWEAPSYMVLAMTDKLSERIKLLSKMVDSCNASSINDALTNGTYCSESTLIDAVKQCGGFTQLTESLMNDYLNQYDDDVACVELQSVTVYKNSFRFECTPKHLGEDCLIRTEYIPIELLDDKGRYSQLITAMYAHNWIEATRVLNESFTNEICEFSEAFLKLFSEHVAISTNEEMIWTYSIQKPEGKAA